MQDPFPIANVFHVTNTYVDAATVVVTDLCENLSNSIKVDSENILEQLKKINTKKFNSISVSNHADGVYPVWVGVDKFNKVRKIFVNTNSSIWDWDFKRRERKKLVSSIWIKQDLNDQFFNKSNKLAKRIKIFDLNINSGAIAIADYGGHFQFEHHDFVRDALDDKYFKINNIYQNNYPIGLFIFTYGDEKKEKLTLFKSKDTEDLKNIKPDKNKKLKYVEFLSNLLDESCYPTKYIFGKYIFEEKGYNDVIQIKIKEEILSADYLLDRLPKALEILKKQNKILFAKNFKEVHEIRKSQFENFIYGIIKEIEPQVLDLSSFKKDKSNIEINKSKLKVETAGLPNAQETFYDGYKLKSEPSLLGSATIPVRNGKYPCYIHTFTDENEEDEYQYNYVYVVIEGIEDCYLNRNSKGEIFFDKLYRESLFLKENVINKTKKISIDTIDLRNSESLEELERLNSIEEIELHGFKNIKNWNGLSKLKNLKKLKLISCDIDSSISINFFKNLYSLINLEEFIIDDTCFITTPNKIKFPKELFFKKLKTFRIDFRKEWKEKKHTNTHQGYGTNETWGLHHRLCQIYDFPNCNKFKSLEEINFYNFHDEEYVYGTLFHNSKLEKIKHLLKSLNKNKKIKNIFINGLEIQGSIFCQPSIIVNFFEKLSKYKKYISINNKKISESTINLKNIRSLELICDIKKLSQYSSYVLLVNKHIAQLNYLKIIEDKEKNLFKNFFNKNLEEIKIKGTFQFFRFHDCYCNEVDFINLKNLAKYASSLKKIIFEFDDLYVKDENYQEMEGTWDGWETNLFLRLCKDLLEINNKIILQVVSKGLVEKKINHEKIDEYINFINLYYVIQDSYPEKNRFQFDRLNNFQIKNIYDEYLLKKVDSVVVYDDNMGLTQSKKIRDVEFISENEIIDYSGSLSFNAQTVNISIDPYNEYGIGEEKIYKKEARALDSLIEDFYRYSNEKFISPEDSNKNSKILFVKKKFLEKSNKIIFANLKRYYQFTEVDYFFDKFDNINYKYFWKVNQNFNFPKSVKFNKLQVLQIYNGPEVNLNNLKIKNDFSDLEEVILHNCISNNKKIPKLPKLKKLLVENKFTENDKQFTGFENITNVENLIIKNIFKYNNNRSRWNQSEFDFTEIYRLKKIKSIVLEGINPKYLAPLGTLKNLEKLDLSLKLITANMYCDDGTIDNNLEDKDFAFLQNLKNLKHLKLSLPKIESSVIGEDLLKFINRSIEILDIKIFFYENESIKAYNLIKYINKNFLNLKELSLDIGCKDNFESNYKSKKIVFRKTGEVWQEGEEPRPFIFDFKNINNLKKLEKIEFNYDSDIGFKVINANKIISLKKLNFIKIDENKFDNKALLNIQTKANQNALNFLNKLKKLDKNIKNEDSFGVKSKDREKYYSLKREIKFGLSYWGKSIETIIKNRKNNS